MPDVFTLLAEFDRRSREMELQEIFTAKVVYKEKREQGLEILFDRTIPTDRITIDEGFERAKRRKTAPDWYLKSEKLDRLGEEIRKRWKEEPWPMLFHLELKKGEWILRYGPMLNEHREGGDLDRLIGATIDELTSQPEGWNFGDPGEMKST